MTKGKVIKTLEANIALAKRYLKIGNQTELTNRELKSIIGAYRFAIKLLKSK
jgi:hypothetical protein